tara:strand:- start:250 stop:711 length:462 start_codon:yes stop_codon:yes gene_type:complete
MTDDGLHALVYSSTETAPLSPQGIEELLAVSRQKNARLGITGILIYGGGGFAQYLEGARAGIDALFATISNDPRHQNVWLLAEGPIKERVFQGWAMSYRAVTPDILAQLPDAIDPVEALQDILEIPTSTMMIVLLKSLSQSLLAAPAPDRPGD